MKKVRRTQAERRESTKRKLIDAATEALVEHGYDGATVQEICTRAEISQGGMFRHFPTREALMVAVGEDVGAQLLTSFRARWSKADGPKGGLRLLRAHCRSRLNQAWYALSYAARTETALKAALKPVAARYHKEIEELGRELMPEIAERLGPHFGTMVGAATAMFDGECLHRNLVERRAIEDARLALLERLLQL